MRICALHVMTLLTTIGMLSGEAAAGNSYVTATASASTTLKGKAERYAAWRALDGDPATGWCEGTKTEGLGEQLVINFRRPQVIKSVVVLAGFQKSEKLYKANNHPTVLEVATDGAARDLVLVEGMAATLLDEGFSSEPVGSLSLGFTEVTKGKVNDSCISEVLITTDEGVVTLAEENDMAELFATYSGFTSMMEGCDVDTVKGLLPIKKSYATQGNLRLDAKPKPKTYKKAAALAEECETLPLEHGETVPFVIHGLGKDGLRVMADERYLTALDFKYTKKKGWHVVGIIEYLPPETTAGGE